MSTTASTVVAPIPVLITMRFVPHAVSIARWATTPVAVAPVLRLVRLIREVTLLGLAFRMVLHITAMAT